MYNMLFKKEGEEEDRNRCWLLSWLSLQALAFTFTVKTHKQGRTFSETAV